MTDILGIKIITNLINIAHTNIGLYSKVNDKSELRFCEYPLFGMSETWKSGFIKNISTIEESATFKNGGSIVNSKTIELKLKKY